LSAWRGGHTAIVQGKRSEKVSRIWKKKRGKEASVLRYAYTEREGEMTLPFFRGGEAKRKETKRGGWPASSPAGKKRTLISSLAGENWIGNQKTLFLQKKKKKHKHHSSVPGKRSGKKTKDRTPS